MPPRTYPLTAATVLASVGAGTFCLDLGSLGKTYRLHTERPGPGLNLRPFRTEGGGIEWRADLPSGAAHVVSPAEPATPSLIRVDISGPLEQRAGYHDPCGGWSDGHDAVADRLCAAFREGDALLVVDGPGGAAAGIGQNVERVLKVKAEYGRRCTGFVDEQCASAHAWWTLAVCDEVFGPAAMQIGSVGARGEHTSIAGMLAQDGIVKTYFSDPPDKVALAPEFPLSEVGAARGNRDVTIAAGAFRAAICASPIGQRFGLTPEALIALGADMLTGENAVGVFVDGVESFDAVVAYALALAEIEAGSEARGGDDAKASHGAPDLIRVPATKITGATRAKENTMSLRANSGTPPGARADSDEDKEPEAGRDIPTKCKSCAVENPVGAHYCMGCGESMETEPAKPEGEDPPPSSKPKPAAKAPEKMSASASLASILGADGTSDLALKTAAINLRQIRETAVGITGKTTPGAIVGALLAIPEQVEAGKVAAANLTKHTAKAASAKRWALAHKLNGLGLAGRPRSSIFEDKVNAAGERTAVALMPEYAKMELDIFENLVAGLEKSAPPVKAPWEANRKAAEAAAQVRGGAPGPIAFTDDDKKRLENHDDVMLLRSRGSGQTVEQLVAGLIATNPQSARAFIAQQNGATS